FHRNSTICSTTFRSSARILFRFYPFRGNFRAPQRIYPCALPSRARRRVHSIMLERPLKELNSSNASVREAALREARALPPEQLLQLFEREIERKRHVRRLFKRRVFYALTIAPISMCSILGISQDYLMIALCLASVIFGVGIIASILVEI